MSCVLEPTSIGFNMADVEVMNNLPQEVNASRIQQVMLYFNSESSTSSVVCFFLYFVFNFMALIDETTAYCSEKSTGSQHE